MELNGEDARGSESILRCRRLEKCVGNRNNYLEEYVERANQNMEDCQKFDNALFSMLQECNGLPLFLDSVFGFLNRRTDFYSVAKEANSPVGLPDGFAEEYVRRAFFKWKPKEKQLDHSKPEEKQLERCKPAEKQLENCKPKKGLEALAPEIACEVEIPAIATNETEVTSTKNDLNSFSTSESYNGAACDRYSWSQSISEVDISVTVPDNITTKQLTVEIHPKRIVVKLKHSGEVLLEGELCHKCKHQDAIWSLDKTKLQILLEKVAEVWWDCLTLDEPKLDVTKIDCSRPYEDLSEEAQAKIEELTWNQERKRLGLPTSDELIMSEKLKKAWNAPGSPFSGPFNPDAVLLK